MTKPQPAAVVSAASIATVEIPGTDRVYVLRAPTFGEMGELASRAAGAPVPSDPIFADALRQAIEASALSAEDKARHIASIAELESADDDYSAFYAAHGTDRASWDAEAKREMARTQKALLAAQRARQRAEWAVADDEAVATLRRHQMIARQREQVDLAMLCVESVNGELRRLTAADVAAMPAGDVMLIHDRAMALVRPGPAAEKN